jgi:hypothetical protein
MTPAQRKKAAEVLELTAKLERFRPQKSELMEEAKRLRDA